MIHLSILGPSELRDDKGVFKQSFLSGPKRLAVFSYLALDTPKGYKRRDNLLPLFWPSQGQKSARNALSNILYHIRQSLGNDIIINRGKEEIALNTIWCDVAAFEEAIEKEDLHKALKLYRGTLLEGLHVPDVSTQFEQWLDRKRNLLKRDYLDILESLAQRAEKRGDTNKATQWWYKLTREAPFNTNATKHLIESLVAGNKKPEAIQVVKAHAQLLEKEFGANAGEEVRRLIIDIEKKTSNLKARRKKIADTDLDPRSIAVLPFDSTNGDEEIVLFTTGLHNDLLTKLSRISALKVIARNSVLYYRRKDTPLPIIGRKLGVGTIVEGSVQFTSQRIRLYVQVTDVRNEQLLWANTYERQLTTDKIFNIQSELSEYIVEKLRTKLTSNEKEPIKDNPTKNIEAYHHYVQGRTHLAHRTERNILRALTYFRQAIEQDPKYALAWSGLAESLVLLTFYNYKVPDDAPDTKMSALKAVELNPGLGEAHATLGIFYSTQKKGLQAIQELEKAIMLQPSYAEAHIWLGWIFMILGKPDKAISPGERAAKLDPMAPYVRIYLGKIYLAAGEFRKALQEIKSARKMQPEFTLTHFMEGLALYHMDRFSEAHLALKEAEVLATSKGLPSKSEIWALSALSYLSAGKNSEASKLFPRIQKCSDAFSTGLVLAAFDKIQEAFTEFEKVNEWGYFNTAYWRYLFPKVLGPLRNDKRYKQLLKQVDKSWDL